MTDNAERKVRQWAKRRNGDPLKAEDVVELVLAVDEDADTRHDETLALLAAHTAEADVRDARISELEEKFRTATLTCSEKVMEIVKSEHEERHGRHMDEHHAAPNRRANDPDGGDFTGLRKAAAPDGLSEMLVGWRAGKWLLMIVIIAALGWLLPYWADSCAAENYEKINEPEPATHVLESPAPDS